MRLFIRNSISKYFTRINIDYKHGLILSTDEALLGQPVIMIFTYLPPENSPAYSRDETNGLEILAEQITQLRIQYPNHAIIVSGDLNARTKCKEDYICDDDIKHLPMNDAYDIATFRKPKPC